MRLAAFIAFTIAAVLARGADAPKEREEPTRATPGPKVDPATATEKFLRRPTTQIVWASEIDRITDGSTTVVVTAIKAKDPTVFGAIGFALRVIVSNPGSQDECFMGGTEYKKFINDPSATLGLSTSSLSRVHQALSKGMSELSSRPFAYDEGWNPRPSAMATPMPWADVDHFGVWYRIAAPPTSAGYSTGPMPPFPP